MSEFRTIPPKLTATEWNALLDHGLVDTVSYKIRKNGEYYEAINGNTGKIDFGGANNAGGVDGTDASQVIQSAIDALYGAGGRITIKAGEYLLSASIRIQRATADDPSSYIILEGEGESTVLKFKQTDASNCIEILGVSNEKRNWFGEIRDLQITTTADAVTGHGIYIGYANYWTIRNVHILNVDGDGVHIGEQATLDYASQIVLERVFTQNVGGWGIWVGKAGGGVMIQCCPHSLNGYGIKFDGSHDWGVYRTILGPNVVEINSEANIVDRIHFMDFHQDEAHAWIAERTQAFLITGTNRIVNVIIEGGDVGHSDVNGIVINSTNIYNLIIKHCNFLQGGGSGTGIILNQSKTGEVILMENYWGGTNYGVSVDFGSYGVVSYDSEVNKLYPMVYTEEYHNLVFDSISDAVNFLGSNGLKGEIILPARTFNESVAVTSACPNIVIRGRGRGTVIDGGTIGTALKVTGDNVTIRDLSLKTTGGAGNNYDALYIAGLGVRVENVWILDADRYAILIYKATPTDMNIIIRDVTIEASDQGVSVNPNCQKVYLENIIGYVTENCGTATIPSGQTSVTVEHGLAGTPTIVFIEVNHDELKDYKITNKTSTQFTVEVPNAVSADRTFSWRAWYEP